MKMNKNSKGFTLVEILVAVIILSVGILTVSQMTVMGLRVTRVVNERMHARVTMAQVFEDLNNRPYTDLLLLDPDWPDVDYDNYDPGQADHEMTIFDPNVRITFQARWNVRDQDPSGFKTIRIHILWGPMVGGVEKYRISTDLIKRIG